MTISAKSPLRCVALMLSATVTCLSGCGGNDRGNLPAKAVWRFAIEESEGSVQHEYALKFKGLIEERTAGAVEVIVYPYGTLGTSTHMTEQLNMGVIDLAMASPGSLGKFIPQLQAFLLHFVLPQDDRETRRLLSAPDLVAYFDKLYAPKGMKLLSIFSEGEMVWTMQKETRRLEDFRGVKMRVMTSPILLAAYRAYGASPTPLPYSEVYSALQLNMIDGQVNPIFAIERQKFHEVTSWLVFPGHASFITTCAANRDFFAGLARDRKDLVVKVVEELDSYIFDVQTRFQSERLKTILRDKKQQQSVLNVCGDLSRFVDSLTTAERRELIIDNPYLRVLPGISHEERARFRHASEAVREVFLEIGGLQSDEVLDRLLASSSGRSADTGNRILEKKKRSEHEFVPNPAG